MDASFEWPSMYRFPPFFTIQPNHDTLQKQLEAWRDLVLRYFKHNKLSRLDVAEAASMPLFHNKEIGRKLNEEGIMTVLDNLAKTGNVEWEGSDKKRCLVYYRGPQEWADIIYEWVFNAGMTNQICTVYELHAGDNTTGEEFHGMDVVVLKKALKVLEKRGKAQVFHGDNEGEEGVKFF
eukprot:Nk52_evm20s288 gene=Nk52_evmTU20s288